jgi:hypothetical protein
MVKKKKGGKTLCRRKNKCKNYNKNLQKKKWGFKNFSYVDEIVVTRKEEILVPRLISIIIYCFTHDMTVPCKITKENVKKLR